MAMKDQGGTHRSQWKQENPKTRDEEGQWIRPPSYYIYDNILQ